MNYNARLTKYSSNYIAYKD